MNDTQRVGDAERDAAIAALREHASAGRLTFEEFDERMARALEAKVRADLSVLFEDLPGGAPGAHRPELSIQPLTDAKASGLARRRSSVPDVVYSVTIAAIWIAFMAAVLFGAMHWWMFWLPMVITGFIADDLKEKGKQRKQLEP